MGRDIRRVPPDWVHPTYTKDTCTSSRKIGDFQPLYDEDYRTAAEKWMAEYDKWRQAGAKRLDKWCRYFWEGDSPPNPDSYRTRRWTPEEATAYQMYETVSEGTPVTPVCETEDALIDYLVEHGDYWDQKGSNGGWSREAATRFVGRGWAPSLVVENFPGQPVKIMAPREQT